MFKHLVTGINPRQRLVLVREVPVARRRPRQEPTAFKKFRQYRPEFSTTSGMVKAALHKVGFSKHNGEPVAYYLLRYYDSNSRTFVSAMYLYAMRRGQPTQIQMLSRRDHC